MKGTGWVPTIQYVSLTDNTSYFFSARIQKMTGGNVFTLSTIVGGGGNTPIWLTGGTLFSALDGGYPFPTLDGGGRWYLLPKSGWRAGVGVYLLRSGWGLGYPLPRSRSGGAGRRFGRFGGWGGGGSGQGRGTPFKVWTGGTPPRSGWGMGWGYPLPRSGWAWRVEVPLPRSGRGQPGGFPGLDRWPGGWGGGCCWRDRGYPFQSLNRGAGRGYPSQVWMGNGGTPFQGLDRGRQGYPFPGLDRGQAGVPLSRCGQGAERVPASQVWIEGTRFPGLDGGVPPSQV